PQRGRWRGPRLFWRAQLLWRPCRAQQRWRIWPCGACVQLRRGWKRYGRRAAFRTRGPRRLRRIWRRLRRTRWIRGLRWVWRRLWPLAWLRRLLGRRLVAWRLLAARVVRSGLLLVPARSAARLRDLLVGRHAVLLRE